MAAYAVVARIGRVEPHLTVRDLERDLEDVTSDRGLHADASIVAVDIMGAPETGRIVEWIRRFRELWTQTTFYVFDSESWRT